MAEADHDVHLVYTRARSLRVEPGDSGAVAIVLGKQALVDAVEAAAAAGVV